jgi:hypothetical protein
MAVPFDVAYATLTAPLEPPVRDTLTVSGPVLWFTAYVAADNLSAPALACWLPVIVAVAVTGDPNVAPPVAADRVTLKLFVPVNGVAVLTGTLKVFAAVSPLAQLSVPLAAV